MTTGDVLGLLARLEMMLPALTAQDVANLARSPYLLPLVCEIERLVTNAPTDGG